MLVFNQNKRQSPTEDCLYKCPYIILFMDSESLEL